MPILLVRWLLSMLIFSFVNGVQLLLTNLGSRPLFVEILDSPSRRLIQTLIGPSEYLGRALPRPCLDRGRLKISRLVEHFREQDDDIEDGNVCLVEDQAVLKAVRKLKFLPPGVDSGDTIRVPEAGHVGGRRSQPGDLFIKLKVVEDRVFTGEGADVDVVSDISFTQAMLGGKVEVPILSGKVPVKVSQDMASSLIAGINMRASASISPLVSSSKSYFSKQWFPHQVMRTTQPMIGSS